MDRPTAETARIERLRDMVDRRLSELLPDPGRSPHRLAAAMRYALLSPGKRLRPILTLLTAWRLGAGESAALDPACALEMVHAASLILDDLPCMDDAQTRRGADSAHVRYGEDIAMLAAVALLNQAFGVLAGTPGLPANVRLDMIQTLSSAVGLDGLVAGQEGDLQREPGASLNRLSDIHHRKTGVMFVAAVRLGALIADAPPAESEALERFATELGQAFQAADDIRDEGGPSDLAEQTSLIAVLGRDGARRVALERLDAAKSALDRGGAGLAALRPYVDVLMLGAEEWRG